MQNYIMQSLLRVILLSNKLLNEFEMNFPKSHNNSQIEAQCMHCKIALCHANEGPQGKLVLPTEPPSLKKVITY